MSDAVLDALAEAARNRGLKLVRSRVRTPGKQRFGKVGLTDSAGKAVFGMDAKGPTARPEEAEAYLRTLNANDWGASLDVAAPQRKRTGKPPAKRKNAANDEPPTPAPPKQKVQRKAPPRPAIRHARPADAPQIVSLMKLLKHDVDAAGVRKRISALAKQGLPQLVATIGKDVVGLVGVHAMTAIHRDKPVGRITILVVGEEQGDKGIGRLLMQAAEDLLRRFGCAMIEMTSNDRLTAAHSFYRHFGYERTSIRFCKPL